MAGLWGARNELNRTLIAELGSEVLGEEPKYYWDYDQALLRRHVWPEARKSVLQHDSYSCGYKKFNEFHQVEPFPTKRTGDLYVGWGNTKEEEWKKRNRATGIKECPKRCRPEEHQDWIYC